MAESTQHKLDRVRPPRVQITYDVETGGAIEKKELPFIVGVLADLSGDQGKPPLKDRTFTEIDRDNFNDVLGSINPELNFRVDNKLTEGDDQLNVSLEFEDLEDFNPSNIVQQVEPLRKLFEARQRLADLAAKLEGNAKLESLLQDVLDNTDMQEEIHEALNGNAESPESEDQEDESDQEE
ncbi:MAG: type VI secretion system contractile sheath small subunit [Candidatus Bipolaricaulia bacterium]